HSRDDRRHTVLEPGHRDRYVAVRGHRLVGRGVAELTVAVEAPAHRRAVDDRAGGRATRRDRLDTASQSAEGKRCVTVLVVGVRVAELSEAVVAPAVGCTVDDRAGMKLTTRDGLYAAGELCDGDWHIALGVGRWQIAAQLTMAVVTPARRAAI